MKKTKYLINGFGIHFKTLEKYIPYEMVDFFPKPSRYDIITNYVLLFKTSLCKEYHRYYIIHINCWENFLNFWNRKGKIIIGESHGFHFGLNFEDTLKHFRSIKKIMASLVELALGNLIRFRIKKFDIYYVSTPNMLAVAKKIRIDAKWLPNCIDFNTFKPDGKKAVMKGDPIIFYPTRIHSFKNPTFGIDLFQKIKSKYPGAVLHLIHYPNGGDELYTKYRSELIEEDTYVWHEFKTKTELSEMYRAADIVLGHFHKDLGMMSLVELQAISCGTAVISYDKYEIKTDLKDLEELCFAILADEIKYKDFVNNCRKIVTHNHNPKNIAKIVESDISRIEQKIHIKKMSEKLCFKHKGEILSIEEEVFSEIGTWDINNFVKSYYNKFEGSFLLFIGDRVVGYIVGYSDSGIGYVNRLAISEHESGKGLGNYLMTCFHDNLKYNLGVNGVELVCHKSLGVDKFYTKMGYSRVEDEMLILDFLKRKNKEKSMEDYEGENKFMQIFYKNI